MTRGIDSLTRSRSLGRLGPGLWWLLAATGLILTAAALVVLGTRADPDQVRRQQLASELRVLTRDVTFSSTLAMAGDKAALARFREFFARVDSTLTLLVDGAGRKGDPASSPEQFRSALDELAARWRDFKGRAQATAALNPAADSGSDSGQPGKEKRDTAKARAEKRPRTGNSPAARRTPARASGRQAEASRDGEELHKSGHALVEAADRLQASLSTAASHRPAIVLAAMACVLGALGAMSAFGATLARVRSDPPPSPAHSPAARPASTTEVSTAQLLHVLRPAMRALGMLPKDGDVPEPLALGRRLSDAMLDAVDGMRRVVRALDGVAVKANESAEVGRQAATSLAAALNETAAAGTVLRTNAQRVVAAQTALVTRAGEAQEQSQATLEVTDAGMQTANDSARLANQVGTGLESLAKNYKELSALNEEIIQRLTETSDLSTHAAALALTAAAPPGREAGDREAAALVAEVRSQLGSSAIKLAQVKELMQAVRLRSGALLDQLERTTRATSEQSCKADDTARALIDTEMSVRQLAGTVSVLTRLAGGADLASLLPPMDDIAKQLKGAAADAQRVLDATVGAAEQVDELTKLLSAIKPS